jgi:hypothetical protein
VTLTIQTFAPFSGSVCRNNAVSVQLWGDATDRMAERLKMLVRTLQFEGNSRRHIAICLAL